MDKQKKTEEKQKAKEEKTQEPSEKEIIDDLTDTLQRLQAEVENFKKRVEKENAEHRKYVCAEIIKKLLPVLDSFELALRNTADKEKFMKGVELIYAQFYGALEAEGLKPIKAVGEKFDPYRHEVLLKQESDKDDEIILEELQKGYALGNFIIRHSKVKISENKRETNGKNKNHQ